MQSGAAIDKFLQLVPGYGMSLNVGLTIGPLIFMPTPAYLSANILGGIFQTYQKKGFVGGVRSIFTRPKMTASLVQRLFGVGKQQRFRFNAPSNAIMVTKDGRVYNAEMLAREAQLRGLNSSFIRAETIESIADDFARLHSGPITKAMYGPRVGVNFWTDVATASDNYYRVCFSRRTC